MKTVCLIIPPSCFLLDEKVFASLGILKVAASLEMAGHVEVLDLSGVTNYVEALADHAMSTSADVFGITATTPQMPACVKIVEALRRCRPDARLILGGPHVTLVHASKNERAKWTLSKLVDMFDVLVVGDGEDAILEAVKPRCRKLVNADDPKGRLFLTNKRLGELPLPARHLIDMGSYHYSIDGVDSCSMVAQLGCPFSCNFCGGRSSPMLRRIRTRTTASVVAELRHLHDVYGYRGCMMYDDELNVNKSMVELMNAIADMGIDWRLRGFIKAELFTNEQAAAMYRAGFRWILVGFESGSERILRNINKKATRDDNTRCLRIAHKHGLKVKALMSIGHPGESETSVTDTEEWLMEQRPDDFDVTVITTYPGTPYYDQAVCEHDLWRYTINGDALYSHEIDFHKSAGYYKGIPGEYQSFVFTDYLTANDIVRLRDDVERGVRAELGIPYNHGQPGKRYEASMGQLPGHMLRKTS